VKGIRSKRERRAAIARIVGVLGALTWLCHASPVRAKLCGDDVQGQHVPCACGDTVVSDLTLTNDPVSRSVCPGDGLIVRASGASRGITVDLRGKTLRGSGQGAGLWVVDGGPGGARIVSKGRFARLAGFRDGIVAQGSDTLALVDGVVVVRSLRDGVRVNGSHYVVNNTQVVKSGRDGFCLSGHDFRVTATRAVHSGRYGYFVMGVRSVVGLPVAGNASEGSGDAGFSLEGAWNSLSACKASGAVKDGVRLNGSHYIVDGCVVSGNGGSGIVGSGIDWQLSNNLATQNRYDGLVVRGVDVIDRGGNRGSENLGQRWRRAGLQCAISRVDCGQ
jgi:hypothetical protein